jgi:hypothetical protein
MNLKFYISFVLLVSLSGTASANGSNNHAFPKPVVKKAMLERRPALKLYPNPSTTGTIRVESTTAGKLHFYIFDLEGTLLHQAVLSEKEKHTITNLKKGVYTYDAFYKDESIEHGKLIVK